MNDILSIAVFDAWHHQNVLRAGLSAGLTIFEQPGLSEPAIVLCQEQHTIAPTPELRRQFFQRPFTIVRPLGMNMACGLNHAFCSRFRGLKIWSRIVQKQSLKKTRKSSRRKL